MVDDRRQAAEIRRTVRRARGYWYRAGVPRPVRRRKADELTDHLDAAVRDGHTVEDVVGRDLAAFAAAWAQADRKRPWLEALLHAAAVVTGAPAGLALLWPVLPGRDRTGFDGEALAFLASLQLFLFALLLLRWQRARLTTQHAALLGVVLFVGYLVLQGLGRAWAGMAEVFFTVPRPVAWTLLAIGVGIGALTAWLRRTQRL